MSRLFAVGEIHGCDDLLAALLDALDLQAEDTLIFLGDFIDRGKGSRQVVDMIRAQQEKCHVVVILGNHEQMMLDSFDSMGSLNFWLQHGGAETLRSFGLTPDLHGLYQMPKSYYHWINQAWPYYETERFIFTHATPEPDVPMKNQSVAGLRWLPLPDGYHRHLSGKTVVCGHTEQRDGRVYQGDGIICIDTFAYGGQYLTALELHSMTAWQVGQDLNVRTQVLPPSAE